MNINEVYPDKSIHLKAADLRGREVPVKISGYEVVEFDSEHGKEKKLALKFEGKEKGLVLNKTNARKIADAYGQDSDQWAGKEIIVYPDKTEFNGQLVDCLRVRIPAKQANPDDPNDDIPF